MSNLYTFLAGFDPYNEDDEPLTWSDDDEAITLKLDMDERRDFDATLNAIRAARIAAECDLAWKQHEAAGDGD